MSRARSSGRSLARAPLALPDALLLVEGARARESSEGDAVLSCSIAHRLELVGYDTLEVDLS